MAEFDDLIARLRRQKAEGEEALRRLGEAIEFLERAKTALGNEGVAQMLKAVPPPPELLRDEPKRRRGILSPRDIATTIRTVLREFGRPMKRGELVAELERRDFPLAGRDKNKNLGTILWRHSGDFVHLEKLGYWLRDVPLEGVYTPDE